MSAAIAEQAKRIEQTRAEAQHWKSKYEVVQEEHQKSSALLNDLYHKERLLSNFLIWEILYRLFNNSIWL